MVLSTYESDSSFAEFHEPEPVSETAVEDDSEQPLWVRTKTGRQAKLIMEATDEFEAVGLLEYENGERVVRREWSFRRNSDVFPDLKLMYEQALQKSAEKYTLREAPEFVASLSASAGVTPQADREVRFAEPGLSPSPTMEETKVVSCNSISKTVNKKTAKKQRKAQHEEPGATRPVLCLNSDGFFCSVDSSAQSYNRNSNAFVQVGERGL